MKKTWTGILLILTLMAGGSFGQQASAVKEGGDSWLGRDKAAHLSISLALIGYSYHLMRYEQHASQGYSRNASLAISLGWGLAKETRDAVSPRNHFCFKDLTADILGAAVGLIIFTK